MQELCSKRVPFVSQTFFDAKLTEDQEGDRAGGRNRAGGGGQRELAAWVRRADVRESAEADVAEAASQVVDAGANESASLRWRG